VKEKRIKEGKYLLELEGREETKKLRARQMRGEQSRQGNQGEISRGISGNLKGGKSGGDA